MTNQSAWQRSQPAVSPAGDCGGDTQIGNAFNGRWQRPLADGNTALVTRNFYVALNDPNGPEDGPTHLECQTEYLVCADPGDPGSTEVWSDAMHTTVVTGRSAAPTEDDAWHGANSAASPTEQEWRMFARWNQS